MERNAAVKEEEESFRRQLLASFAEQDRVEQMNDHKRRMCIEQHKREANRLVAEKQALQAAAEVKRILCADAHLRLTAANAIVLGSHSGLIVVYCTLVFWLMSTGRHDASDS